MQIPQHKSEMTDNLTTTSWGNLVKPDSRLTFDEINPICIQASRHVVAVSILCEPHNIINTMRI